VLELERLVSQHVRGADQQIAIVKSVRSLFVKMAVLDDTPKDHSSASLIQRWAIECDDSFLALCEARNPIALILLAWYALLCQKRANIWFFRRWPQLLLHDIGKELQDSEWSRWVSEPDREIERLLASSDCNEKD
jgi:hypothetical protein